ncbi:MAG: sugar kinase [Acidobacteria bacterium]|nr:sugar kinase [Acidobacteriota bacterium]
MGVLKLRAAEECAYDIVSLGEVMLRFDPGDDRIAQTRHFRVWEGGGEYNVARGLRRVFGKRAAVVTAFVDNPVGRLAEDLMLQGGVDLQYVLWREYDGLGVEARNGMYFMERGFGVRNGLACMDRGHTAVSQMKPGDVDWDAIFSRGVRVFHTGGIMAAISASAADVVREGMAAAKRHGVAVSYDCNYRASLWKAKGGRTASVAMNRELAAHADILFGHDGDLAAELGEASQRPPSHTLASYREMAARIVKDFPNVKVIATTTRVPHTASRNDFGAFGYLAGECFEARELKDLAIFDRVGGGDGFASGVLAGLMEERGMDWALNAGVAHGALVMSMAGDNSYATRADIERVMSGGSAGAQR